MLHARQSSGSPFRKAQKFTTTDPPEIDALRKQIKKIKKPGLDPAVRAQAGELLTRHDLAKSAYEEGVARTEALVAQYQQQVTARSASLPAGQSGGAGIPTGANGRDLFTGLTREDLGAASQTGNRGDVGTAAAQPAVGPHVTGQNANEGSAGQQGSGGVSSLPRLEKELAEATDPILKARLGEQVTLARLRASHR